MSIEEENNNIFSLNDEIEREKQEWGGQTEEELDRGIVKRFRERTKVIESQIQKLNTVVKEKSQIESENVLEQIRLLEQEIATLRVIIEGLEK